MEQSRSGAPDAPDLGIAVIGRGEKGDATVETLGKLDGVRVVAHLSAREVDAGSLADPAIDAVAVCSASGDHVAHARLAVEAGKHVVVEKPLSLDVASARGLLADAAARGVHVAVISQRRWEVPVVAARAAIEAGVLGRPVLAEYRMPWRRDEAYFAASPWRGSLDQDGGVLWNQAIHGVDLLRHLLGPVARVTGSLATRVWDRVEAPDSAVATLTFGSGALAVVAATVGAATPEPGQVNLYFEHGTIRFDDEGLVEWLVPAMPDPTTASPDGGEPVQPPSQWQQIVDALRSGGVPEVTGPDALCSVALVEAIHRSAAAGGVPVVPDVS